MDPSDPTAKSRRQFLEMATGVLTALGGLTLGFPLAGAFVGPSLAGSKWHYTRIGPLGSLPSHQPVSLHFVDQTVDGFLRETQVRSVWVVQESSGSLKVFSPICPHLGCQYNWDQARHEFLCPCHGSRFALDGRVLGGPAPRPLDTLPFQVENGVLSVEWQRFKLGIPEKVPV
ncbi:MAG TPA: ubiquinol-cytochrome c reductase iron-sulfur subunit [Candidatus Nitrosotenuis sp.]|jgi:menaquinol-cytochrome c reductase iron-sulfur subunit|nr:ubiquinol-cytochrome c reductase iron-sulfur subunit [Candidatus Nitrosotenuis sp.]